MNIIEYTGISKKFKSWPRMKPVLALDDFSLHVKQGEVFGFLGPNGAGKSTAMKILMNLIFPDFGTVSLMGKAVDDPQVRQFVGYLPENPYFYDYLTAHELLWFGGKSAGMSTHTIQERSDILLGKVDLFKESTRPLRTYSKGMVQRAGLALALIHDPTLVILDEPMSGLDPIGRKMVGDLLLELKAQGKTVFFSSHILTDIERFCDRVAFLVSGKVRLDGNLRALLSNKETLEDIFLRVVRETGEVKQQ